MKLSIVIPCYNEEKNIPLILARLEKIINDKENIEVVLVDNGSTDNTAVVLRQELTQEKYKFARVVTVQKNIGYGHGIMSGLRAANGNILAWTHADMQTDPADVIRAYDEFLKINKPDSTIIKGRRINRRFGSWAFTFGMSCIASTVLMKKLYDINAQPKLFAHSFLANMKNPPDDFSLDLYLLYQARQLNYNIQTIPVHFGKRIHGESRWAFSFSSRYKTILRSIKYIFALRKKVKNQ
jgi:glycosyltransferase involved in cell wall biosynthesis